MTSETAKPADSNRLLLLLPAVVLTIAIAVIAWFGFKFMEDSDRRFASQHAELTKTVTELSQTRDRLKQAEEKLLSIESQSGNIRAELIKLQRNSYDHERMLSTIFKIEKVGNSVASFRSQDGQSFSIGAGK